MSLNIRHNMIHSSEDYSAIERLRTVIGEFSKVEINNLEKKYRSIEGGSEVDEELKDLILENVVTNLSVTARLDRICDELVILALYKKVEMSILNLFEIHYPNRKSSDLYNLAERKRLLKINGHSLEGLKNHKSVDELRCLCNAIKHQGKVTDPLSKFSGWTKGEEISGLSDAYKRIVKDVPDYIVDFDRKIRPLVK